LLLAFAGELLAKVPSAAALGAAPFGFELPLDNNVEAKKRHQQQYMDNMKLTIVARFAWAGRVGLQAVTAVAGSTRAGRVRL
jgi:hypothetical protein